MTQPAPEQNTLDVLLDRGAGRLSKEVVKAVEDQTRQIEQWTKDFVDRSEAVTERVFERLENQSRPRSTR